jgi:hypothetical protein
MKLQLLTLTLTLLLGLTSNAQEIQFGIKGGLNLSTFSGDGTDDGFDENKPLFLGLNLGVQGLYSISEEGVLQIELEYSRKGVKYSDEDDSDDYIYYRLNYLNLPILYRHSFGSATVKGFALAGPYLSYALNGKLGYADETSKGSEELDFGDDGEFQRADVGFSFGGGLELKENIGIELRIDLGFSNLIKDNVWNDYEPRNTNISITGYYFL